MNFRNHAAFQIALYASAFLDAGQCFSKMSVTVHAGTINNDLDITIATLGLENFEIGDKASKRSRVVHEWVKHAGHSYGFDLKVKEHHCKLLESFKMNYDFVAAFQDNEIIFVDTRRFDDAASNKDLRGHLGCHPDNMETIVNSATFRRFFPVLQRQVIEAVCSGAQQLLIVMVCKSGRHRSVALMEFFHYCLCHTGLNVRAKYHCSEGRHWQKTCGGACASCCWHKDQHNKPARINDILVNALYYWKANLREWKLLPPEEEASPVSPPDRNVVCVIKSTRFPVQRVGNFIQLCPSCPGEAVELKDLEDAEGTDIFLKVQVACLMQLSKLVFSPC